MNPLNMQIVFSTLQYEAFRNQNTLGEEILNNLATFSIETES